MQLIFRVYHCKVLLPLANARVLFILGRHLLRVRITGTVLDLYANDFKLLLR